MNWQRFNLPLVILPFLLSVLGAITLSSTSPQLAESQLLFLVLGATLYFLAIFTDYKTWGHLSRYIFFINLVLLVVVYVAGKSLFGSTRWLEIGGFSLQPSEFMKLSVALYLSFLLSKNKNLLTNMKGLARTAGLAILAVTLVFIQPDLGTSLVLIAVAVGILWAAGLNKMYFLIALLFFGVFSAPAWNILKPYQKERILVFINPTLDTLGIGYNVIQSTIAVGSGQILGKGFGQGTQSHLQFLPVYWTDFVFAAFAEEWGFVGVLLIMILYLGLLLAILFVAKNARDSFGHLVAMSAFLIFFSQFTVNVGMNLGILPVTGIPLPLISYGGSSFLVSMTLLGLVQSVWINSRS